MNRIFPNKLQTIFTARGVSVTFLIIALSIPGYFSSDIIASVVSAVMIVIIAMGGIGTFILGRHLKKSISIFVTYELSTSQPRNGTIVIKLTPFFLPPIACISFILRSARPDIDFEVGVVRGSVRKNELLSLGFSALHRGVYPVDSIEIKVHDTLSFFSYSFFRDIHLHLEVPAPLFELAPLELFAGTISEGDLSFSPKARFGDQYDLKPYNPSDGMKKIAWKVFARKGELISRFPEETSTPEGSTWVYVAAGTKEDGVASHALEYIRQSEERGLLVHVGIQGTNEIANSFEQAQQLFIDSAWDADKSLLRQGYEAFLSNKENNTSLMVIFSDIENISAIEDIKKATPEEIKLIFFASSDSQSQIRAVSKIKSLIFEVDPNDSFTKKNSVDAVEKFSNATLGYENFIAHRSENQKN